MSKKQTKYQWFKDEKWINISYKTYCILLEYTASYGHVKVEGYTYLRMGNRDLPNNLIKEMDE